MISRMFRILVVLKTTDCLNELSKLFGSHSASSTERFFSGQSDNLTDHTKQLTVYTPSILSLDSFGIHDPRSEISSFSLKLNMASGLREDGVGVGGSWVFIKICKLFNDHLLHMGVYSSLFEIFLGEYHCSNYKDFLQKLIFCIFQRWLSGFWERLSCLEYLAVSGAGWLAQISPVARMSWLFCLSG